MRQPSGRGSRAVQSLHRGAGVRRVPARLAVEGIVRSKPFLLFIADLGMEIDAAVGHHWGAVALVDRLPPQNFELSPPSGDLFRRAAVAVGTEPLRPIGGTGQSRKDTKDAERTKPRHGFLRGE